MLRRQFILYLHCYFLSGGHMIAPQPIVEAPGVLLFKNVEIQDVSSQRAYAYLHVTGGDRDLPSHEIRVFLNATGVSATADHTHPGFATEFMTYNSPVPSGPAISARSTAPLANVQNSPQILMDISEALTRIGPVAHANVTLLFVSFNGEPLDISTLRFDDISITRRK